MGVCVDPLLGGGEQWEGVCGICVGFPAAKAKLLGGRVSESVVPDKVSTTGSVWGPTRDSKGKEQSSDGLEIGEVG